MEKTIRELVSRVASTGGFDTDTESIVQYQDIIGHATEEENHELANTPQLMESFYRIYGCAYGTVAAIKFYLDNSDRICNLRTELDAVKGCYENQKNATEVQKERAEDYKAKLEKAEENIKTLEGEVEFQKKINSVNADEITRLKAKLYDLQEEVDVLRKKVV